MDTPQPSNRPGSWPLFLQSFTLRLRLQNKVRLERPLPNVAETFLECSVLAMRPLCGRLSYPALPTGASGFKSSQQWWASVVAGAALMGSLVDFQSQHYDSPSVLPVTLLPVCSREAAACLSKDRQWERDNECSSTLHSVNTCCRCFLRQILVMFWFKVLMLSQGPAATIG